MFKRTLFLLVPLFLIWAILAPIHGNAYLVQAGDEVRLEFSVSAQDPQPPYYGITFAFYFSTNPPFDYGDGWFAQAFYNDGTPISNAGNILMNSPGYGIGGSMNLGLLWGQFFTQTSGYIRLDRITGSFDLIDPIPEYNYQAVILTTSGGEHVYVPYTITVNPVAVPEFSCEGFEYPMNNPFTLAGSTKGRIFPLKMSLYDNDGPIIGSDLDNPPVYEWVRSDTFPNPLPVSTSLPRGDADEGNQFIFRVDNGKWELNLSPTNIVGASGTYTIRAVSGNSDEYTINPTSCSVQFVIPAKPGKGKPR